MSSNNVSESLNKKTGFPLTKWCDSKMKHCHSSVAAMEKSISGNYCHLLAGASSSFRFAPTLWILESCFNQHVAYDATGFRSALVTWTLSSLGRFFIRFCEVWAAITLPPPLPPPRPSSGQASSPSPLIQPSAERQPGLLRESKSIPLWLVFPSPSLSFSLCLSPPFFLAICHLATVSAMLLGSELSLAAALQ